MRLYATTLYCTMVSASVNRYQSIILRPLSREVSSLMLSRPLVSVVDDDESIRESLPDLLNELGFDARTFSSGHEFLASAFLDQTRCLLLDVAMPGMTGPELHQELLRQRRSIPVVFITANPQEAHRRRMVEGNAPDCLIKPFSDSALFDAVTAAIGETDDFV